MFMYQIGLGGISKNFIQGHCTSLPKGSFPKGEWARFGHGERRGQAILDGETGQENGQTDN